MTGIDGRLRARLLRRAKRDQWIRTAAPRRVPPHYALLWLWIDRRNAAWLRRVVRGRGWPGRSVAGEDGAQAAWLIAQHADRSPEAQRMFLDALRAAVASGEADPADLARLEDRVRVNAGRPQLYGTQYGMTETGYGPHPVEDPERLDERRAAVGLPPQAEYDAEIRRLAAEEP
ncbi:DUF6624 domain-containing protein [Actinomadura sp. NPDC047616]|uniref:DUF6624 domain-containing protein n=1 Tax=Actinomadura sp. NPDC047616 TaxID=3155914 RepID=UPI0033FEEBD7